MHNFFATSKKNVKFSHIYSQMYKLQIRVYYFSIMKYCY